MPTARLGCSLFLRKILDSTEKDFCGSCRLGALFHGLTHSDDIAFKGCHEFI